MNLICIAIMLSLRKEIKVSRGMVVPEDIKLNNHDDLEVDLAQA